MRFTVNVDLKGVQDKFSGPNSKRARMLLAERVRTDSNVHCMYETGATFDSATVMDKADFSEVAWTTPYARYAYYAKHARTAIRPAATTKWFETAASEHLSEWEKLYSEELLR